jgi:hypothetical protein
MQWMDWKSGWVHNGMMDGCIVDGFDAAALTDGFYKA